MKLGQIIFGNRESPGTSRHRKPSDGIESMHITYRDQEQQRRIRYLERKLGRAKEILKQIDDEHHGCTTAREGLAELENDGGSE